MINFQPSNDDDENQSSNDDENQSPNDDDENQSSNDDDENQSSNNRHHNQMRICKKIRAEWLRLKVWREVTKTGHAP